MHETYNPYLVALSLLIAILASYTILDLAARIQRIEATGSRRKLWMLAGAVSMGSGIWSLHFVGMLACPNAVEIGYSLYSAVLSFFIAVGTCYLALQMTIRHEVSGIRLATGSALMATGIVAMHHVGMAAMRVEPAIQYHPLLFLASTAFAYAASWVSLRTAFTLREHLPGRALARRGACAVLMGCAIGGTHYVGMAAAIFPSPVVYLPGGLRSGNLPLLVAVLTLFGVVLVLVTSRLDSRFDRLTVLADLSQVETSLDTITGIAGRTCFLDQTEHKILEAKEKGTLLGILFLNLDGFKAINDTLGFSAGDELLKAFSEDLLRRVRSETVVGRFGGDEFALLIDGVREERVLASIAKSIYDRLQKNFRVDGVPLRVTASAGVAIYPRDGETVADLVKSANIAMDTAKRQGRNNCRFFDPAMRDAANRTLHINRGLGEALEQNQFHLVYQPKFDSRTNHVLGAEALIRWTHPTAGNIPPMDFIPVAEENGQIVQISEWVIREVCRQIKEWERLGLPPLRVSVNLSPEQLLQEGYAAHIESLVAQAGVSPGSLLFEITETAVMREPKLAVEMIRRFQHAGFDFAIDDFGTGYSSMAYLQQFRVKELKIDRFFIGSLEEGGPEEHTIVSAIIALAHALHMTVVAEGVETAYQLRMLKDMHCDEIQGYLLGKPMDPAHFEQLVRGENEPVASLPCPKNPQPILHSALV